MCQVDELVLPFCELPRCRKGDVKVAVSLYAVPTSTGPSTCDRASVDNAILSIAAGKDQQ